MDCLKHGWRATQGHCPECSGAGEATGRSCFPPRFDKIEGTMGLQEAYDASHEYSLKPDSEPNFPDPEDWEDICDLFCSQLATQGDLYALRKRIEALEKKFHD